VFKKRNLHISISAHSGSSGGGANTFAWNFHRYLNRKGIATTNNLIGASHAIIISNKVNKISLKIAKAHGCFILHRLDEEFESGVPLKTKHQQILQINKRAHVTVFQSNFVKENILPHLQTKNWEIIINGADSEIFPYHSKMGSYIGHVTNSVGGKKRLDILDDIITRYPQEKFLLVGNHNKYFNDFSRHHNVIMKGSVSKKELSKFHQQMKCLFFPSERDPCPNTVVEAILSGIPVCYNIHGGTKEIVKDCGLPLEQFDDLLEKCSSFHAKCAKRQDLLFDSVAEKYLKLLKI
jgi:glycosyltransferase involved in cell wall biosynthesis